MTSASEYGSENKIRVSILIYTSCELTVNKTFSKKLLKNQSTSSRIWSFSRTRVIRESRTCKFWETSRSYPSDSRRGTNHSGHSILTQNTKISQLFFSLYTVFGLHRVCINKWETGKCLFDTIKDEISEVWNDELPIELTDILGTE